MDVILLQQTETCRQALNIKIFIVQNCLKQGSNMRARFITNHKEIDTMCVYFVGIGAKNVHLSMKTDTNVTETLSVSPIMQTGHCS